ncbi:MAG: glycosyltransferase family 2 protein [Pseudomonadota bacterium]
MLCVVRNERDILPAFLDHYRELQISEFVFIDHASTDGTGAYLHGEAGVTLMEAHGSYRTSYDGLAWLNAAGEKHCAGRWTIVVDADEFLILPFGSGKDLAGVIRRLDREISLGIFCPLVDFYPGSRTAAPSSEPYRSFAELTERTPHFFPVNTVTLRKLPHFPCAELRSRIREQVTRTPGYIPPLGKVPLFFWHEGFRLKRSSHEGSILPLSDETGVLCHFKYRPGAERRAKEELARAERQDMTPVQSVLNAASAGDLSPGLAGASEFRSEEDLADAGWLGDAPGSFAEFWIAANQSRQEWTRHLLKDQGRPLAQTDAAASSDRLFRDLLNSRSWRLTYRLRSWLVTRQHLPVRHLPERYPDPQGPAEAARFITGSIWWDLTFPVRLAERLGRRKRWRLLK